MMITRRQLSRRELLAGVGSLAAARMGMIIASAGVFVFLLRVATRAEACTCAKGGTPCEVARTGDIAFIGTPTAASPISADGLPMIRYRFRVEERLSGDVDQVVEIDTAAETSACGYPFAIGHKYLVNPHRTSSGFTASICSRTGTIEARQLDINLLRATAAGKIQSLLAGVVVTSEQTLDGFYMHTMPVAGLAGVLITVRGPSGTMMTTTSNRNGEFQFAGLTPGTYTVESRLPPPYVHQFGASETVTANDCLTEVPIFVATRLLSGTARDANGQPVGRGVMVRIAQLDSTNKVAFARSALAFTQEDGYWSFPGLPPGRYLLGVNTYDAPARQTPYSTTWYPSALGPSDATVIDISDGKPKTIDFRLPRRLTAVSIVGLVVDEAGKPVANASVSVYDDDDPHAKESYRWAIANPDSNAEGRFSAVGFAGRRYHVEAVLYDRSASGPPLRADPVALVIDTSTPTVTLVIKSR